MSKNILTQSLFPHLTIQLVELVELAKLVQLAELGRHHSHWFRLAQLWGAGQIFLISVQCMKDCLLSGIQGGSSNFTSGDMKWGRREAK